MNRERFASMVSDMVPLTRRSSFYPSGSRTPQSLASAPMPRLDIPTRPLDMAAPGVDTPRSAVSSVRSLASLRAAGLYRSSSFLSSASSMSFVP